MSKYIILLGAPGAGKGTQATMLTEALGVPHVASGDLFRSAIQRKTHLGLEAKKYMDQGLLVPDEVTIAMVRERLALPDCQEGVILDGFPRTLEQAKALDAALADEGRSIDQVLYIKVPNEELVARLSGRWICGDCQAVYHAITNPPKQAGRCDACGGELYQRSDDKPETVRRRLEVYFEQTAPLIEYYTEREVLTEVNGDQSIAAVQAALIEALQD
ncbi:MAG: adenylate kinase [Anaerolineae bacterium]